MTSPLVLRIPAASMETCFGEVLVRNGFTQEKASLCASIFVENSLEGIYTHGVNRFPRFVQYVRDGYVKPDAEPTRKSSLGAIEQWHGQLGPGPLNAIACTDQAMKLAATHGIGCVGLSHTNHWMRGGTYGWRAAKNGYGFIGWTNTTPNMPAWGAVDSKLGNNPLVLAVPFQEDAIVLDMAMSQFSYGSMELKQLEHKSLPVPGGYDEQGQLSTDPGEILKSQRPIPIGYWKGSGLSLLLDLLAATLADGLSTHDIAGLPAEFNLSQVFICFHMNRLGSDHPFQETIQKVIDDFKTSTPLPGGTVRYPGERIKYTRQQNLEHGIPVLQSVWEEIEALRN